MARGLSNGQAKRGQDIFLDHREFGIADSADVDAIAVPILETTIAEAQGWILPRQRTLDTDRCAEAITLGGEARDIGAFITQGPVLVIAGAGQGEISGDESEAFVAADEGGQSGARGGGFCLRACQRNARLGETCFSPRAGHQWIARGSDPARNRTVQRFGCRQPLACNGHQFLGRQSIVISRLHGTDEVETAQD